MKEIREDCLFKMSWHILVVGSLYHALEAQEFVKATINRLDTFIWVWGVIDGVDTLLAYCEHEIASWQIQMVRNSP